MSAYAVIKTLHVIADLVWVGSILAVAVLLSARQLELRARGQAALAVYRRLANPAFGVAFVLGVTLLVWHWEVLLVAQKFMHGKLVTALAVIALHHVLGAHARRAAAGTPTSSALVGLALGLSAAVTAAFAVLKPF